jgi:toxin ParE1/3/4
MATLRRSPQAHLDFLQIWLYVAERDPRAADRLLDRIEAKCRLLAGVPGLGRARPELRPDLRSFPVGRFVIFYREVRDGIEIVRVLRGARDLPALFNKDKGGET